jgi:hypothetical protein
MAAIDPGAARQIAQPVKRAPHLVHAALDHPAAAKREQGVADEDQPVFCKVPGNMAPGVPGRVDDFRLVAGKVIGLARLDRLVDPGDTAGIGPVGHHLGAMTGLQRRDGGDVVVMVMGDEDMGQFPPCLAKRPLDGRFLGRVDGGAGRRVPVAQQNAEIVLAA